MSGLKDTENIWDRIEELVYKTNAINFGHGFTDLDPPPTLMKALEEVAKNPSSPFVHQYARRYGHMRLVNSLVKMYSPAIGMPIDPATNVIVTIGANHALYCAAINLAGEDDEVIFFEPYYTLYDSICSAIGAKPVHVKLQLQPSAQSKTLTSGDFKFDRNELASKFNKRTKLVILNNPNNPLGKVFTREELEFIAGLCIKHDVTVIADEVYWLLVHPPMKHISFASLPGMWERTLTVGTAGKMFHVTGWKIGWSIGPQHLIAKIEVTQRVTTFNCPTPLQEALAIAFEEEYDKDEGNYFKAASKDMLNRVKRVAKMVASVGMVPIFPESGYFLVADASKIKFEIDNSSEYSKLSRDLQLTMWLLLKHRVATIPLAAFLSEKATKLSKGNFIRFCCYKSDETLQNAEEVFNEWKTKS